MKPIVIVGSINMDMVSRVPRIPAPGETLLGTSFGLHPGGKGANQAVAVAKLGHEAIFLGKVGDDLFGPRLRAGLEAYGVITEHVEVVQGSSGTASIVVDERGENSIIVTPEANFQVTPEYVVSKKDVLRGAGIVLVQLEIPIATVAMLGQLCEELGVPLMLDPAPSRQLPDDLLERVTWFTPNETEARFYCAGEGSSEDKLQQLFARGLRNVVLKEGAKGAIIASRDGRRQRIDPFPVKAVDTTAAGDSFNGAFAVALISGFDLAACGRFAAAAASISVTRHGAQASLATWAEVEESLSGGDGRLS